MDIICLSHLKWEETLFQRPQQIMLRLARHSRVLYLASCGTREYFDAVRRRDSDFVSGQIGENLHYQNIPFLPFSRHSRILRSIHLNRIVRTAKARAEQMNFKGAVLWIYYPAFVDHIGEIDCGKMVYDCMDQFSGFESSDAMIVEQEKRLLEKADIVFTGGRSLQRDKEGVNPRTYCFPSGVEFEHFFKATLDETIIPSDVAALAKPIIGYIGAIDERIDYDLIQYLCDARPHWSFVFIGPTIHGDRPMLERPNFFYLGKKRYGELPNYLKAFDVCLMPFVQSQLTEHISPTKTPEYLAAGKPVVSTPVPDVMADYADVVRIGRGREEFLDCIEEALNANHAGLRETFLQKASAQSWDAIAEDMMRLLKE